MELKFGRETGQSLSQNQLLFKLKLIVKAHDSLDIQLFWKILVLIDPIYPEIKRIGEATEQQRFPEVNENFVD